MEKSQVYYTEVDENGDVVEGGMTLIEGNYLNAINDNLTVITEKKFVKIENNPPETNANQVKNYLGWSQKSDDEGKPVSTDWEVTTLTNEECKDMWIRGPRQILFNESDWTQTNDCPLSDSVKAEWATYRSSLRDLTSTFTDDNPLTSPDQITWPIKPGTSYVEPPADEE